MNSKVLFQISILLLLINMILLESSKEPILGTIESIRYSDKKITLTLQENNDTFIIFTENFLDINKKDKVKVYGIKNIYRKQEQIIVSKLIKMDYNSNLGNR